MSEYANICVNMPKSARMTFVLYYLIVIPGASSYLFQCLRKTRGFRLKENEAVFFKT